ncbi:hypothetical protein [Enterococcus faecium]|uniref:hypothetical protein n=1 Tax=Enterococcus faecium TaxID=1352 RepID=UPI0015E3D86F|nr:hypothetical protein [Enterococcus faecium]
MGLFSSTYKVKHNEGFLFDNWITVLENVTFEEAEQYIKSKTEGLFGESKEKYKIVKE